jgi:mannosyltransferase
MTRDHAQPHDTRGSVIARQWLILLVIAFAAFALRIFHLAQQNLWYDEAFSVYLARMDLGAITARTAADIQPPLYYYLLHFWVEFTGISEFAVRFLSLLFGVLTVPLLYVVARRSLTLSTAFFAALLASLSPLYLWYSQETRMYTLITFLGLLSSYCLLRALEPAPEPFPTRGRGRWWIAFAGANIAAVYTHYFAFVIIAFQLVYALWQVLPRVTPYSLSSRPRWTGRNIFFSFGVVVVAFLPWLPFVLARFGEDASYWRGALKLDEAIRHIFISFTMGESVLEAVAQNIAVAWLIILLVGTLAWLTTDRKRTLKRGLQTINESLPPSHTPTLSFAILYLIIPLALLLVLFYRNPKFNARYLMIASPAFLLLLAAGLGALWSLVRRGNILVRALAGVLLLLAVGGLFASAVYADYNAFFDPAFTKPDFRGVAQYIAAHAQDDEVVVLTSGHMFPAFDYYYTRANLPELRLPDDPTLDTEHVLNYAAANDLNRGLAGRRGVWLVQWQDEVADPNGFVPMLLSSRGTEEQVNAAFWQIKLRHWTLPANFKPFAAVPEVAHSREANFKNEIKLLGWSAEQPTSADVGATFNLYFQSLATFADDYNVALRIVDAQGNLWGKLDRRPAGYNYPTTRWKKGENLFGSYTVPLLSGAPAGDYYATVTFFTASDETGLDVLAPNGAPIGKSVKIGPIRVLPAAKPPSVLDLQIQHTLSIPAAPFTLLGYSLPRDKASTGESIPLTLFWRADAKPGADYTFQVQFGDQFSAPQPLANEAFPTSQWRAGEIVRAQFLMPVPPDASAGDANLQLRLSDNRLIDLRQPFSVEKTDRVFTQPNAQFEQEANFGNLIALAGYTLSAPQIKAGDTLTVTLNWKALGKLDKPYTVFVHLLDKEGKCCAGQKDGEPVNGARPTTTWVEGEYLVDAFAVPVKPDARPGEYRVEIGWYDAKDPTFARLPVLDANGNSAGDSVMLSQRITIISNQ